MTSIMRVRAASRGWSGGPGLNTFYFTAHGGPDPDEPIVDDAQLAHDRVHDAFAAATGMYPTSWKCLVSPNVDVLSDVNGELTSSFSVDPSAEITGSSGVGFGPTAAMALLRLNTSTFDDGSRIQGRAFLGPVGAVYDADGSPSSALLTVVNAFATAIQDAGVSLEPVLVVWRRPREADSEHLPHPVTARDGSRADVTSVTVPDKFAVLRSRRD